MYMYMLLWYTYGHNTFSDEKILEEKISNLTDKKNIILTLILANSILHWLFQIVWPKIGFKLSEQQIQQIYSLQKTKTKKTLAYVIQLSMCPMSSSSATQTYHMFVLSFRTNGTISIKLGPKHGNGPVVCDTIQFSMMKVVKMAVGKPKAWKCINRIYIRLLKV